MPGIARFLKEDEKAVYHVISRTALDGLPFKDTDRERENQGQANNA
jgi:hypothetical protein